MGRLYRCHAPTLLRLVELLPALLPGVNNIPDGAGATQRLFWAHRFSTSHAFDPWVFTQLPGLEEESIVALLLQTNVHAGKAGPCADMTMYCGSLRDVKG